MKSIQSNYIGNIANHVLKTETGFEINGKSSRGIFLTTSTRWILFLSFEIFRNPLTINLIPTAQMPHYAPGTKIEVSNQRLIFPNNTLEINLENSILWPAPALPTDKIAISQEKIITSLMKLDEPLLAAILSSNKPDRTSSPFDITISKICTALPQKDLAKIIELASSLLGLGNGLTPEGDDFITGLFFALYYNQPKNIPNWKKEFFETISKTAYQKTTQISANLIECAQNGLADERLADAYQAIKYNLGDFNKTIHDLLNWGNTSGRMALIGISAGILFDQ